MHLHPFPFHVYVFLFVFIYLLGSTCAVGGPYCVKEQQNLNATTNCCSDAMCCQYGCNTCSQFMTCTFDWCVLFQKNKKKKMKCCVIILFFFFFLFFGNIKQLKNKCFISDKDFCCIEIQHLSNRLYWTSDIPCLPHWIIWTENQVDQNGYLKSSSCFFHDLALQTHSQHNIRHESYLSSHPHPIPQHRNVPKQ